MIELHDIDEAKNRLVKAYNPNEIYLFGIYAWGKPDEESDLGLLVLVDQHEHEPWKKEADAYKILFDIDAPKEIIFYPKDDFDSSSQEISSFFYKIKNKGKKIY